MDKKKVVLSGVNMTEGGILTIYRELINEYSKRNDCELICLVHSKEYFYSVDGPTFIEYPQVKKSWFRRIYFEYIYSWFLSKRLKPDVWFCLHDMTANVKNVKRRFLYCHNPSPFYKCKLSDFFKDKKFFLFTKFYKFLYEINISKNSNIFVQQKWMADKFSTWFDLDNINVARPEPVTVECKYNTPKEISQQKKIRLLYPAVPRVFKNFEILLDSMLLLKELDEVLYRKIELIFTFDKGFNKMGDIVYESVKSKRLDNVTFTGFLSKGELDKEYDKENTLLVFPSRLETWGLPITEAKIKEIPMIVADLPYAKETVGDYDKVSFFDVDSPDDLLVKLRSILSNIYDGNAHHLDRSVITSFSGLVDFTLK